MDDFRRALQEIGWDDGLIDHFAKQDYVAYEAKLDSEYVYKSVDTEALVINSDNPIGHGTYIIR